MLSSVSFSVMMFVFVLFSCLPSLSRGNGSARLIEPAMRSSLWRFDALAAVNLNDQSLDCGGPQIQFNLNRGRCGVCGDPYNGRKENEKGGKYDSGIVARRYRTGSKVTMIADLVAGNGGGYFEVKLCARNNPRARVTQACFNKHRLQITNGKKRRLQIPRNNRDPNGLYRLNVRLPKGVTCTHCVIQWHYHAANEWGYDANGRGCMGCGPQTEIFNCADVAIGYYGDPEAKLDPSEDLSRGPLAEVYDIYANGEFGTGVSPIVVNSGINQGWASANDLNVARQNNIERQMANLGHQSSGFANLFNGEGNNLNLNDNSDDFGFDAMMMVMGAMGGGGFGGGGGGSSGSGERGRNNFRMASFSNRNLGGGGSGSSEESGGRNNRRNNAMAIPSISQQYNRVNVGRTRNTGGSSGSSEEGGRNVGGSGLSNRQRLQESLRKIANRQKLRNGLNDFVTSLRDKINNRDNNDNVDYYDPGTTGGEQSSEEEVVDPNNLPNYFKDQEGTGGDSESSEGGNGAGGVDRVGGNGGDYYDGNDGYGNVPIPEPENNGGYIDNSGIGNRNDNGGDYYNADDYTEPNTNVGGNQNGGGYLDGYENNNNVDNIGDNRGHGDGYNDGTGITDIQGTGGAGGYKDIIDNRVNGGNGGEYGNEGMDGGNINGDYNDYGDIPVGQGVDSETPNRWRYDKYRDDEFVIRRQEELDRRREEKAQRDSEDQADSWRPPMMNTWPYNYQLGLMSPQNGYGMWANSMNPSWGSMSKQYSPWQMSAMLSNLNSPNSMIPQASASRLGRTLSPYTGGRSPTASSMNHIFPWMPSAQAVMTLGASKSPIFSQRVANQYMSPYLMLSQTHPALRCQRPDQLICVATSSYRNIPNADQICTTKCRAGGACGSDYCSCACQKSLMCVHRSSQNAPGQFSVTEMDMWCTDQCNSGQCPNQACACSMVF